MSMLPQCEVALDDDSIPETVILDDIDTPEGGSIVDPPEMHNLSAECEECVSLVGTQAETLREVDELHQGLQKGIAELGVGSIVLTYDQKVAAKTLGHKLYTDEGRKALEGWDRVLWKNRKQCGVVDWAYGEGSSADTLDSVLTDSEIRNAVRSSGGTGGGADTPEDAPSSQHPGIEGMEEGMCPRDVQDKETGNKKSDGKDVEPDPYRTPLNPCRLGGSSDFDTPSTQSKRRKSRLVSAWDVLQSNQREAQQNLELEMQSPGQPEVSLGERMESQSRKSKEGPQIVPKTGGAALGPSERTGVQTEEGNDVAPAVDNIQPGVAHWACTDWVLPPDPGGENQIGPKKSVRNENQVEQETLLPAPSPSVKPAGKEIASAVDAIPDSEGDPQGDVSGKPDQPVEATRGAVSKRFHRGKAAPRLRTPVERQQHKNKLLARNLKQRAKVLGTAGTRSELTSGETGIGLVRKVPAHGSSGSGGNDASGKHGLWHRVLTKRGSKDGDGKKKEVEIGRTMWRATLGGRSFEFPESGSDKSPPEKGDPFVIKSAVHPTPPPPAASQNESGKRGGSSELGKASRVYGVGRSKKKERQEKAPGDEVCDLTTPLESMCPEFSLNPAVLPAPNRTPSEEPKWKRTRKGDDSGGVKKLVDPWTGCDLSESRKSPMSSKETPVRAGKTPQRTPPSRLKGGDGPSVLMSPNRSLSRSPNRLVDCTALVNRGQDLFARDLDGERGNIFGELKFVVTGFGSDSDEIRSKVLGNGGMIVKSCGGPCSEEGPSCITLPDVVLTLKGSRTSQYLACVSRGCGAVTPKWIDDCLSSDKLLRADPAAGHVVLFPRPHLKENAVFEGMRVYIHGDDKFQEAIGCVLQHGGAAIMSDPESRVKTPRGVESSAGEACVDLIVAREIPKYGQSPMRKEISRLQRLARRLGVPVKDKEWAVNCILEGVLDLNPPEATPERKSSAARKSRKTPPSTSRLAASKSPKGSNCGNLSGKRRKGVDSESNFEQRPPKKGKLATVSESPSAERVKRRRDFEPIFEAHVDGGDSLSTRHPATPIGVEQTFVAETPESTPPNNVPPGSHPKKRPCSPSDFASCKLTWIGNPATNLEDDGVALHRDFYLGFLLRGKEIKVNDFVELFPAPGERRARVVQLEAMWSERPQGGEERMLARCRRFYWPQEVCVPVECFPNEVFSTDHVEDMVSLRAIVQKCSVQLMDVHQTPSNENTGRVAGNYKCRLHYHQNEGTVAKTRLGLWK